MKSDWIEVPYESTFMLHGNNPEDFSFAFREMHSPFLSDMAELTEASWGPQAEVLGEGQAG